ncbi:MAG TPA: hypothetical protein VKV27_15665 [Solirubrobacteraceae bacterium]|nr:hypothetical protein [Solirubrobacteraceae bacterium]
MAAPLSTEALTGGPGAVHLGIFSAWAIAVWIPLRTLAGIVAGAAAEDELAWLEVALELADELLALELDELLELPQAATATLASAAPAISDASRRRLRFKSIPGLLSRWTSTYQGTSL